MDPVSIGALSFLALTLFLASGVRIAFATALCGFFGLWLLRGYDPAAQLSASTILGHLTNYNLLVLPLFIMMGFFAYYANITRDIYWAARQWLGHLPGGLAVATIIGCAGFRCGLRRLDRVRGRHGSRRFAGAQEVRLRRQGLDRLRGRRRHHGHHDPALGAVRHLRLHRRGVDRRPAARRHPARPPAGDHLRDHAADTLQAQSRPRPADQGHHLVRPLQLAQGHLGHDRDHHARHGQHVHRPRHAHRGCRNWRPRRADHGLAEAQLPANSPPPWSRPCGPPR